ncbi:MAG: DUF4292 domain-containing protein [Muribaculaceae bacterium]|nr:DUF4292 domain-containing protein [Muribaculaceae bacterium]
MKAHHHILLSGITIASVFLSSVSACRSAQNAVAYPDSTGNGTSTTIITPATDASLVPAMVAANQLDWNTLQASGTVRLGGKQSFSSSMTLRMVKNQSIYISLRPLLGIEVGKLLITGDSLLVVDKYHKRYIAENVSLITNGVPITVGTLQDVFLGRAFVIGSGTLSDDNSDMVSAQAGDDHFTLTPNEQPHDFTYGFHVTQQGHISALEIVPRKDVPYLAHYDDVQNTPAGQVATHVQVKALIKGNEFIIELDLNRLKWNENVNIDTTMPSNYKRIDGHQIVSIMEQQ